jgi:hypothetical protein
MPTSTLLRLLLEEVAQLTRCHGAEAFRPNQISNTMLLVDRVCHIKLQDHVASKRRHPTAHHHMRMPGLENVAGLVLHEPPPEDSTDRGWGK